MNTPARLAALAVIFFAQALVPTEISEAAQTDPVLRIHYVGGVYNGGGVTAYFSRNAMRIETKSGYVGIACAPSWDCNVFSTSGHLYCQIPKKQWLAHGVFVGNTTTHNEIRNLTRDEQISYRKLPCRHIQYASSMNDLFMRVRTEGNISSVCDYYVTTALTPGSKLPLQLFCNWAGAPDFAALPIQWVETAKGKSFNALNALGWERISTSPDLFRLPSGYTKVSTTAQIINEQAGSTIKEIFGDDSEAKKSK